MIHGICSGPVRSAQIPMREHEGSLFRLLEYSCHHVIQGTLALCEASKYPPLAKPHSSQHTQWNDSQANLPPTCSRCANSSKISSMRNVQPATGQLWGVFLNVLFSQHNSSAVKMMKNSNRWDEWFSNSAASTAPRWPGHAAPYINHVPCGGAEKCSPAAQTERVSEIKLLAAVPAAAVYGEQPHTKKKGKKKRGRKGWRE